VLVAYGALNFEALRKCGIAGRFVQLRSQQRTAQQYWSEVYDRLVRSGSKPPESRSRGKRKRAKAKSSPQSPVPNP
jgi:hypothetical protein